MKENQEYIKNLENALIFMCQIAIDNGFIFYDEILEAEYGTEYKIHIEDNEFVLTKDLEGFNGFNIIEIITSKSFLEAVTKGLIHKIVKRYNDLNFNRSFIGFKNDNKFECLLDFLTRKQAIAIRDGTLDEFINTILPNDK